MAYAVDLVSAEIVNNVLGGSDDTLVESEVLTAVQKFGVVQSGAIFGLVHREQVTVALIIWGISMGEHDGGYSFLKIYTPHHRPLGHLYSYYGIYSP